MPRHSTLLRAVVLSGGLVGALIGLPASAASGQSGCAPSRVAMTHIRGSDGAGQTGYRLAVYNAGSVTCYFQNEPQLTLLGSHAKVLPTHVHWTAKLETIAIAPGRTVSARLRFSPDVPGPGEPQRRRCEPVARSIRVDLALRLKTLGRVVAVTGPVHPPTSVCEHGRISASPLH